MARVAVFLDRDGTINVERNYLYRIEDWEWIPGSVDAIRSLNEAGFLVIVITNQAGVARGMYAEADVNALHRHVSEELARHGARIDAYYYCPHHPDFGSGVCACRKPSPGVLFRARDEWTIDMSSSWLVGDKLSDIEAGKAAGVRPTLIATGYGNTEKAGLDADVPFAENLQAAVQMILREHQASPLRNN